MTRTVDWNDIPDSTLLPEGLYTMEVDDLSETTTREKGWLMYKGTFRVTESPNGMGVGVPLFDYFVIGNDGDPTAKDAETWKNAIGARRLKHLFKATGIKLTGDVDEMIETVRGQSFIAAVGQEVDDGVKDPKYKGVRRNRILSMRSIAAGMGTPSAPSAAPKASAPKATSAANVTCPFCQDAVPRAQYAGHVSSKHPDEA